MQYIIKIVHGNKTLELRPSSIDKSTAARAIIKDLNPQDIDFILCVGDGKTDEVVFSYLNDIPNTITCSVGKKQTEAKFFIENVKEVEKLLESLVSTSY